MKRVGFPGGRIPGTVAGSQDLHRQNHRKPTESILLRDSVVDQPAIRTDRELRTARQIAFALSIKVKLRRLAVGKGGLPLLFGLQRP
jgi:hypothetical protein